MKIAEERFYRLSKGWNNYRKGLKKNVTSSSYSEKQTKSILTDMLKFES